MCVGCDVYASIFARANNLVITHACFAFLENGPYSCPHPEACMCAIACMCISVCVCVCVFVRARERECVSMCVYMSVCV